MLDKIKKFIKKMKKYWTAFNYEFPLYQKNLIFVGLLLVAEILIEAPYIVYNDYQEKTKFEQTYKEDKTEQTLLSTLNSKNLDKINVLIGKENVSFQVLTKDNKFYVFDKINEQSFYMTLEKELINKEINYTVKEDKSVLERLSLWNYLIENGSSVVLFILLFFIMSKQGLLFNKDKFEIVRSEYLTEKERESILDSLVGMEEIKKEVLVLKRLIENRDKFKGRGVDRTFNYLFSGHSGTGKTKIAMALAKLLGIPFIAGTGNMETGFVGGGANAIKNLFKVARGLAKEHKTKSVLVFLDEAQTLLLKRGQGKEKWSDDTANELLAQLDGVHDDDSIDVIFIAASNFDEKNHNFDDAMMRRFHKKIFFRLPNLEERIDIFKFYVNKIDKEFIGEIDYPFIAEISSKASPANIESIVKEASLLSLEEDKKIDTKILELAFERIFVGKTDRKVTDKQEKTKEIVAKHELGHFIAHLQNELNEFFIDKETRKVPSNLDAEANKKEYDKEVNINKHNKLYLHELSAEERDGAFNHLRKNMNVLKISIESVSQINALGYVLNKSENESLKTRNELEQEIISLYGGLASERVFSKRDGDFSTGSSNDVEKISKILDVMVNKYAMYSRYKINLSHANIDMKKVNTKILCDKSDELYSVSYRNIEEYKELIEFILEHLLKEYVISLDKAIDLIEEFYKKRK